MGRHRTLEGVEAAVERRVGPTIVPSAAPPEDRGLPSVERTVGFECSSGECVEACWRGVPLDRLLAAQDVPGATTHLTVESADGQVACVSIPTALDGLLAYERDGRRLEHLERPRFVAPGVVGPRAVKGVAAIVPVELDPGEDRAAYERFRQATSGSRSP